jgi:hypothetical protein
MTDHPCGEIQILTREVLERESARLLPCPFCGQAPIVQLYRMTRLGVFCHGLPPCLVKPQLVARSGRVMYARPSVDFPYGTPSLYQQSFDELVKAWNTRAPATSGAPTP